MATATPDSEIANALGLIDTTQHPMDVRFATAYATGYIDALYYAKLVTLDAKARPR
ncbi:hypothetical protein [Pseudomonas savastanoi]|uniref:hypothetical protein n=1 Tax=Pseudomonas savastanoi TaxID=29438 RepID=UPI000F41D002|nr:hypothetical protein [Pseudomonas savastanoi]RMR68481.1 hypothetical protein ALP81_200009 [Pseudomonas savastanoi pv. fraxini]